MSSVVLKLKKVSHDEWQLIMPKGHAFGPRFRNSDLSKIREQARIFVSSWYNWTVDDSDCYSKGEKEYESKKDRMPGTSF